MTTETRTASFTVKAENRPHYPFVVITSDGYWGRGQTQAEAIKGARDAGYRKRRGVKVKVIECPPNIRDAEVDSFGALCYFMVDESGPMYTSRMLSADVRAFEVPESKAKASKSRRSFDAAAPILATFTSETIETNAHVDAMAAAGWLA